MAVQSSRGSWTAAQAVTTTKTTELVAANCRKLRQSPASQRRQRRRSHLDQSPAKFTASESADTASAAMLCIVQVVT